MVKRKTYRKPQVNQVKLVPEEAVLTACKLPGTASGSSNKQSGSCVNPAQGCQDPGS